MALGDKDKVIAEIIARVRQRQPGAPNDVLAIELELRAKWGGKRSYASKVVRDALERACQRKAGTAFGKRPTSI
jgi:hypothetical protein